MQSKITNKQTCSSHKCTVCKEKLQPIRIYPVLIGFAVFMLAFLSLAFWLNSTEVSRPVCLQAATLDRVGDNIEVIRMVNVDCDDYEN